MSRSEKATTGYDDKSRFLSDKLKVAWSAITDPKIFHHPGRINEIFFPLANKKAAALKERNGKFVHYTTAENAIKIINSQEMWLRMASSMNDFMEVEHGIKYFTDFLENEENAKLFLGALNACGNEVGDDALKMYGEWRTRVRFNTFLACFSEHDVDENAHGRLSMWRAYRGSTVGVAIVLNREPFFLRSNVLNIFASPVSYPEKDEFQDVARTIVERINSERDFLKEAPRSTLVSLAFAMMVFGSICLKRPGFKEEREWRVISLPGILPSKVAYSAIETIGGVPQPVIKVPLKDIPSEGLVGLDLNKFIDRIIIGPTNFTLPVYEAFVAALRKLGMEDAAYRVYVSRIPLRT